MAPYLVSLLTHPDATWDSIRRDEEANGFHCLVHLLALALIPAACLYLGTPLTGWSLAGNERVRLDNHSAPQLKCRPLCRDTAGRIADRRIRALDDSQFPRASEFQSVRRFHGLRQHPYFLAGLCALHPSRWPAVSVLLAASLYATYLLFTGVPRYMRIPQYQGMLFAASVWGVGLLVRVTLLVVGAILHWNLTPQPTYQRNGQEQGYPTVEERPRPPEGKP